MSSFRQFRRGRGSAVEADHLMLLGKLIQSRQGYQRSWEALLLKLNPDATYVVSTAPGPTSSDHLSLRDNTTCRIHHLVRLYPSHAANASVSVRRSKSTRGISTIS